MVHWPVNIGWRGGVLNFEVAWAVPHGFSCNWVVNWWLQGLGNYSQSGCELFNVHYTMYCWSGFFACQSNHDSTTISSQIFVTYKLPLFKSEFGSFEQVTAVCTHRWDTRGPASPSITSYRPDDWLSPSKVDVIFLSQAYILNTDAICLAILAKHAPSDSFTLHRFRLSASSTPQSSRSSPESEMYSNDQIGFYQLNLPRLL